MIQAFVVSLLHTEYLTANDQMLANFNIQTVRNRRAREQSDCSVIGFSLLIAQRVLDQKNQEIQDREYELARICKVGCLPYYYCYCYCYCCCCCCCYYYYY